MYTFNLTFLWGIWEHLPKELCSVQMEILKSFRRFHEVGSKLTLTHGWHYTSILHWLLMWNKKNARYFCRKTCLLGVSKNFNLRPEIMTNHMQSPSGQEKVNALQRIKESLDWELCLDTYNASWQWEKKLRIHVCVTGSPGCTGGGGAAGKCVGVNKNKK